MIKTRIITDRREIEQIIPQCIELARKAGACLPFNYMHFPLLWWDHFRCNEGTNFLKKRGVNFLGNQCWLNNFYLIITEAESTIRSAVPFVSYSVRKSGMVKDIRVLAFAGDPILTPFRDFLVSPNERTEVLLSIFGILVELLNNEHDLLLLEDLPEQSPNISIIRKLIDEFKLQGLNGKETVTLLRGGIWPRTIPLLAFYIKRIYEKSCNHKLKNEDLRSLNEKLQNHTPLKLIFPGTRNRIEIQVRDVMEKIDRIYFKEEIEQIDELLSDIQINYPYIDLPTDCEIYLMSLKKQARQSYRRYRRRFEEKGGMFEKTNAGAIVDQDINDCLYLHSLRWGEESLTVSNSTVAFHKDIWKKMAAHGYLTLFFACYRGERIAVNLCFDIGHRREFYLVGRDPKYSKFGVGQVLNIVTICDATSNGFKVCELGRVGFSHKMSFTKKYTISRNFFLIRHEAFFDLSNIFLGGEYMKEINKY